MMSAEHIVSLITGTVLRSDIPEDIKAPNTLKVTLGHG